MFAGVGLLAVAAATPWIRDVDFCLDDAWIHLAYARSLQLGDGFSYNPGDHETGASSPLWVLLLAALPAGERLVLHVKLVGVLLHAAVACLSAVLAQSCLTRADGSGVTTPAPAWVALVAGGLTATLAHLLLSATSGMEVSLAAALVLATALACLHERAGWAFVAAFLGTFARPETLFFSGTLGALAWQERRNPRALAAPAGAGLALASWMLWCVAVSGYPWPNTRYVKGTVDLLVGLQYLGLEVLLQRPWVLSVTGLLVLGLGLWRNLGRVRWLMAAWLVSVLAISWTREVRPGGLFFYYRYYAILAPIPIACFAASLTQLERTWQRAAAVLPVVLITAWQWPATLSLQQQTEDDILQLHTKPARYIARNLPKDATVLVEGAGAMRYFTPRSMRIVDVVGLNHRAIAHASSDHEADCLMIAERPTHAAIPDEWLGIIQPLFELRPLARARDEQHHSGRRVFARQLQVFEVLKARAAAQAACAAPPAPTAATHGGGA